MNELKKRMIERAIRKHHRIYPCAKCSTFDDCFTFEHNEVIFWFNTEDKSTHLVVERVV